MRGSSNYRGQLKAELTNMIDTLALTDFQKQMLRGRWLDQLMWQEARAAAARDWYYRLRLTTIIGGVLLPALVSVGLTTQFPGATKWLTFGLSLLIAVSAAIEEFFHYGERWRSYRDSVERLKSEGWQFLELSGPYRRFHSHGEAVPTFGAHVEDLLQREVQHYITAVATEQQQDDRAKATPGAPRDQGDVAHGLS